MRRGHLRPGASRLPAPGLVTIDLGATIVLAHPGKEQAAPGVTTSAVRVGATPRRVGPPRPHAVACGAKAGGLQTVTAHLGPPLRPAVTPVGSDRPLLTGANGPLMARRSEADTPLPGGARSIHVTVRSAASSRTCCYGDQGRLRHAPAGRMLPDDVTECGGRTVDHLGGQAGKQRPQRRSPVGQAAEEQRRIRRFPVMSHLVHGNVGEPGRPKSLPEPRRLAQMRPRRRRSRREIRNHAGKRSTDQLRQPDPRQVPRGDPHAPARSWWLIQGHAARPSSRRARWLVRLRSSGVPVQ